MIIAKQIIHFKQDFVGQKPSITITIGGSGCQLKYGINTKS